MNINWKTKSFIFLLIDLFKVYKLLYFIQKYITKKSIIEIQCLNPKWITHQNNLSTLPSPKIIEFGAGKNLAQNIYLSQFAESQLLVDIRSMIDISLVNNSFNQLSKICTNLKYHELRNTDELFKFLKITYKAPFNLVNNTLEENSFDACISTDTLEHIPLNELKSIFQAMKRILKPNGLISAIVDYTDHYSYSDSSIGKLNFLQFDDHSFRKYNHSSHYQNRLRHYDYLSLFNDLGYELLACKCENSAMLPEIISNQFNQLDPSITATQGIFLLKNIK